MRKFNLKLSPSAYQSLQKLLVSTDDPWSGFNWLKAHARPVPPHGLFPEVGDEVTVVVIWGWGNMYAEVEVVP